MPTIPLFIQEPCAPSIEQALSLVESRGDFAIYRVPLDEDILELIFATRPCVALFSTLDAATSSRTFKLLDQLRRIYVRTRCPIPDAALRTILVAENYKVPLERWQEAGFHEYIPAPISPKSLDFKLARHYLKALTNIEPNKFEANNEVILVKEPPGAEYERRRRSDRYLISGMGENINRIKDPAFDRITIKASGRLLGTGTDVWMPAAREIEQDDGSMVAEDTWVLSRKLPQTGEELTLTFRGERPEYDTSQKVWVFRGKRPRLVSDRRSQGTSQVVLSSDKSGTEVVIETDEGITAIDVRKQVVGGPPESHGLTSYNDRRRAAVENAAPGAQPSTASPAAEDIASFLESWRPKVSEPAQAAPIEEWRDQRVSVTELAGNVTEQRTDATYQGAAGGPEVLKKYYSGPSLRDGLADYNRDLETQDTEETPKLDRYYNFQEEPQPAEASEAGEGKKKAPVAQDEQKDLRVSPEGADTRDQRAVAFNSEKADSRDLRKAHGGAHPDFAGKPGSVGPAEPESDARTRISGVTDTHTERGRKPRHPDQGPDVNVRGLLRDDQTPLNDRSQGPGRDSPAKQDQSFSQPTADSAGNELREKAADPGAELSLKVESEKSGDEKNVRFGADEPSGAKTWSMQNDEPAARSQKRKRDESSPGSDLRLGLSGAGGSSEGKTESIPALGSATSREQISQQTSAHATTGTAHPPAPPEPPRRGWLERIRRFLASIFDIRG